MTNDEQNGVQRCTADNVDTGTVPTDAGPTATDPTGTSECAGVDFQSYQRADATVKDWVRATAEVLGVEMPGWSTTARLALAHPALHPVIELHSPDEYEECQGCDGGPDYRGEWPCRTIELILEGLDG